MSIMKLTILIPVYNEKNTIERVLDRVKKIHLKCATEIIVVDDGSTDGTVSKIKVSKMIRLVRHSKNFGKGVAIQTGIQYSTGDYIVIQDADLEYKPEEISHLLLPVFKKGINEKYAVYGSRFLNSNYEIPRLYYLGNRFLTFIFNLFYFQNLTDMETGYKMLPASFIKAITLKSHRFDIEPEITAKLIRNNYKITEVPISYSGRSHNSGKKLTPIDAFEAIKAIFYYRFFN